jgi:hypothetical protein
MASCPNFEASSFTGPHADKLVPLGIPNTITKLSSRITGHITAAIASVTTDMLQRVWQETDYHWVICRITGGSHI